MDQGQSNTGTRDSTYDLVAVLYHALQGIENCQTYRQDASGDQGIGQFFDQAIQMQRQLADQAKMLLHDRLMQETGGEGGMSGGGSAFQFGSGGSDQFASSGSSSGMSGDSSMRGGMDSGDMQGMGSSQDRDGGSAYTSGQSTGAQQNDQSMGQFGQSAMGQGQRHQEMTTGGGGTSSF